MNLKRFHISLIQWNITYNNYIADENSSAFIDKIYFLINIFNGNDVFQVLLLNKTAYLANDVYDFLS